MLNLEVHKYSLLTNAIANKRLFLITSKKIVLDFYIKLT